MNPPIPITMNEYIILSNAFSASRETNHDFFPLRSVT